MFAACAIAAACQRDADRALSFTQALRCGMTRSDVTRVARERGYNASDQSWLARSAADSSRKTKELSLVDLRFRGGRLVGLREGRYDPRTKRIEYHDVDLCAAETKR
jgi:hypothetical protein